MNVPEVSALEPALYLLPVTLGDSAIGRVLPGYNVQVILAIRHFIVENVRSARRFLRQVDRNFPIDDSTFYELGKHTPPAQVSGYLHSLEHDGLPMGVISEAGCPAVADPGAEVVRMAQQRGLRVVPLVGPSSIILAVMASGMNGQSFAFHGYLPIDAADRARRIKALEQRAYAERQTQAFIETPYRGNRLVDDLLRVCRPQTLLCIAASITCPDEYIRTMPMSQWRGHVPDLAHRPAIFLIYGEG